jgi:hypothetical protein
MVQTTMEASYAVLRMVEIVGILSGIKLAKIMTPCHVTGPPVFIKICPKKNKSKPKMISHVLVS